MYVKCFAIWVTDPLTKRKKAPAVSPQPAILLKITLPLKVFFTFYNGTNGSKSQTYANMCNVSLFTIIWRCILNFFHKKSQWFHTSTIWMRQLEILIRKFRNWLERYSGCRCRCRWILHCCFSCQLCWSVIWIEL